MTTEKLEPLELARRARVKRRDAGINEIRLNPILKAKQNPKSLRMAITSMCYHCQGGQEDGSHDPGWQWGVGNCAVTQCPLHPHRPYQRKEGAPPEGIYRPPPKKTEEAA